MKEEGQEIGSMDKVQQETGKVVQNEPITHPTNIHSHTGQEIDAMKDPVKEEDLPGSTSIPADKSDLFLLILIILALCIQVIVHFWRQKHFRSYQIFTLLLLWLVPLIVSLGSRYVRFVFIWSAVSFLFVYHLWLALGRGSSRMSPNTPRQVYKFFKLISNITFFLVTGGYFALLMGVFLNIPITFFYDLAFHAMFYGLYFGVLGRDLIELVSDSMASTIGYHNPEGMPLKGLQPNTCAICGGLTSSEPFELNCSHVFHNSCIRGWSILGKKEMCPYCKERIDLAPFRENPWQHQEYLYGKFLDFVRYLVVWHPVILIAVEIFKRLTVDSGPVKV